MTTFLGSTWHHYVVTFNNDTQAGEIWIDNQKLTTIEYLKYANNPIDLLNSIKNVKHQLKMHNNN